MIFNKHIDFNYNFQYNNDFINLNYDIKDIQNQKLYVLKKGISELNMNNIINFLIDIK